DDLFYDASV
ncbi:8-amino-7-oxononanoate synthase domain protein, partial [Vibrio parahaemolyticus V-223/04]